jgi:hypothetical protein
MGRRALSQEERRRLIDEILGEIYVNLNAYHDFVLECVRHVVESWSDEDLLEWVGGEDC